MPLPLSGTPPQPRLRRSPFPATADSFCCRVGAAVRDCGCGGRLGVRGAGRVAAEPAGTARGGGWGSRLRPRPGKGRLWLSPPLGRGPRPLPPWAPPGPRGRHHRRRRRRRRSLPRPSQGGTWRRGGASSSRPPGGLPGAGGILRGPWEGDGRGRGPRCSPPPAGGRGPGKGTGYKGLGMGRQAGGPGWGGQGRGRVSP